MKPDYVSQSAWGEAIKLLQFIDADFAEDTTCVLTIARAIQAAELRGAAAEREFIAGWAEATADHYDASAIAEAIGNVPANRAAEKALNGFATAIRFRKGEA